MKTADIFTDDSGRGWVPWALITPFLGIFLVVAPSLPISLELQRMGLLDAHEEPVGRSGMIALLLVVFGAMGAAVLAWTLLVERRALASIGMVHDAAGKDFGIGLLMGGITSGGIVAGIWAAGGYEVAAISPASASPDMLIYSGVLLACFVIQAGAEEILFRGWMMSALARRINVLGAVIIVSIVFTLLHFGRDSTALTIFTTFLFSTFACLWALLTRNIWGVMGWHAGWNWLLGTGFELPITGLDLQVTALLVRLVPSGPLQLTGGAEGPEGSVVCGVFFVAANLFLVARIVMTKRF